MPWSLTEETYMAKSLNQQVQAILSEAEANSAGAISMGGAPEEYHAQMAAHFAKGQSGYSQAQAKINAVVGLHTVRWAKWAWFVSLLSLVVSIAALLLAMKK